MNSYLNTFLLFCFLISLWSCKKKDANVMINSIVEIDPQIEKEKILDVINNETKAAFQRDYEGWKDKWIQEDYVTKTYINFADSSMTETLGWDEINAFVKNYIDEHPEPDPLPTLVQEIDVRVYGNGASVDYEQQDEERGLKRESRLMEKKNGEWKIAGMHTTIYGLEGKD